VQLLRQTTGNGDHYRFSQLQIPAEVVSSFFSPFDSKLLEFDSKLLEFDSKLLEISPKNGLKNGRKRAKNAASDTIYKDTCAPTRTPAQKQ
jgi:hypothetical protein